MTNSSNYYHVDPIVDYHVFGIALCSGERIRPKSSKAYTFHSYGLHWEFKLAHFQPCTHVLTKRTHPAWQHSGFHGDMDLKIQIISNLQKKLFFSSISQIHNFYKFTKDTVNRVVKFYFATKCQKKNKMHVS